MRREIGRCQQSLRIGMLGRCQNLGARAALDHFAILHHDHTVGHRPNHRQVVADEQIRHAVLLLQPGQQLKYLILHRHIQR